MDDDSFWAPANPCERCGGDYELVSVRTVRGMVMVEVCPHCDLGVEVIGELRKAADGS
jgi:hypothetical protein